MHLQEFAGLPMVDETMLRDAIRRFFPSATEANHSSIRDLYPLSNYPRQKARRALYDLGTDGYFACPTRRVALAAQASSPGQVYRYVFGAALSLKTFVPGLTGWLLSLLKPMLDAFVRPWLGAYHGANEVT